MLRGLLDIKKITVLIFLFVCADSVIAFVPIFSIFQANCKESIHVFTSPGNGSLRSPGLCTNTKIWVIGGGGGGRAGDANSFEYGYGGGAGGVAYKTLTLSPAQLINYTVGAGGAGGLAIVDGAPGTNGGDSTVTTTGLNLIGNGGLGGSSSGASGGSFSGGDGGAVGSDPVYHPSVDTFDAGGIGGSGHRDAVDVSGLFSIWTASGRSLSLLGNGGVSDYWAHVYANTSGGFGGGGGGGAVDTAVTWLASPGNSGGSGVVVIWFR